MYCTHVMVESWCNSSFGEPPDYLANLFTFIGVSACMHVYSEVFFVLG